MVIKSQWQAHSMYRGVQVDHRADLKRRNWRIHVTPEIGSMKAGFQRFDSLAAAQRNIDSRLDRQGR